MIRKEALNNIGRLVTNGLYIGELIKITDDKSFRAFIKVMELKKYPSQYGHNTDLQINETIPYKNGEVINSSANSLELYNETISGYNETFFRT